MADEKKAIQPIIPSRQPVVVEETDSLHDLRNKLVHADQQSAAQIRVRINQQLADENNRRPGDEY